MKRLLNSVLFLIIMIALIYAPASAQTLSKAEKRRLFLTGAKLWGIYCNQCHNARGSGEKAPYEWDQEIMHMRTLGNIPAENARAILEYLKAR